LGINALVDYFPKELSWPKHAGSIAFGLWRLETSRRPAGFVAFGQTKTFDVAFEQQLHLTDYFNFSLVIMVFDNVS
jgi:hypothetical protein